MFLPHMVMGWSAIYDSIRIHHECKGGIEKTFPRVTFWHHEAYLVMTIGEHEGRFLYPVLIQVIGLYFLLTIKYSI